MSSMALPQEEIDAIRDLGYTIQASRVALLIGIGIFVSDYCESKENIKAYSANIELFAF